MAKVYKGIRIDGAPLVTVNGVILREELSLAVINHSPTGFEWGYGGSGPAQLALAILLDYTGNQDASARWHQDFKWAFIANAPTEGFEITGEEIDRFMKTRLFDVKL